MSIDVVDLREFYSRRLGIVARQMINRGIRERWPTAEGQRVLAPSGRVIAVIPNRRGVWTRTENTPFGHGRPYSRSQITELLRQTWFTPIA